MRTLRVIGNLEPGGGQLSALRLGLALRRRGWEVRFAAGSATTAGLELFRTYGVEVELYGASRNLQYLPDPGFATWLRPRLAEVDVVHAHQFGAWWAAAQSAGDDLLVAGSEHNTYQWPADPPLSEFARALARLDLLFVHGPTARRELLALGAHAALLREGRSAIDEVEPDLALQAREPARIVYAGRLHPEKGPDILLEALAQLPLGVRVQLVGSGPAEAALRERARVLGLDDFVDFAGWQRDPARWIAGASVCAVPSRFDAWSQTAVLAMALRVPVVGAAVDGLAEVVSGGRGIAVAPESPEALARAIAAVLDGRAAIDLDAAQRYAALFTADAVVDVYERCYADLLASGMRGAA